MKVKDLKPASYNPRQISDEKLEMLRKAMSKFGDLSGVVLNKKTGNLIGGHQRMKHLDPAWKIVKKTCKDKTGTVAMGYIETTSWGRWNYREVNWPLKKEMAANVAANKHGGDFDFPMLKDLIVELDTGAFDMELTGFDSEGLEAVFGIVGPEPEPEASGSGSEEKSEVKCPKCKHKFRP